MITEKDFAEAISEYFDEGERTVPEYKGKTEAQVVFEIARKMAIEFAGWFEENHYRMVVDEKVKHKGQWYKYYTVRKDFPAGFSMVTPVYEYFTTEQLFELYQQSEKRV